jgi:hypothetical protein
VSSRRADTGDYMRGWVDFVLRRRRTEERRDFTFRPFCEERTAGAKEARWVTGQSEELQAVEFVSEQQAQVDHTLI